MTQYLFKLKRNNQDCIEHLLYTLLTKKFVKFVFLFHILFFFGYSANGLAQSSLKSSSFVLRSNFQSNTAATTLHSSSNAKVKAQYVMGQTPLLGKVSVAGVEVRQGFIQPIGFISNFSQPSPALTTSVYPNPFAGNLIIEFNATPIHDVQTSFFDMRGRLQTLLLHHFECLTYCWAANFHEIDTCGIIA